MVRLKKINKKNNGVYSCYFANDIDPKDFNYFEYDVENDEIIEIPEDRKKRCCYEIIMDIFEMFENGEMKIPENGELTFSWY